MSSSPDAPLEAGSLSASAHFPGTELRLLDDDRVLVARAIDHLAVSSVPAGIYTVRAVLGGNHRDKIAVVRPGAPTHVDIEAPAMASAMPIERTAKTHEYHQAAAEHFSRADKMTFPVDPTVAASQSELFIMAREWNRDVSTRRGPRPQRIGGNLTLCDREGAMMFAYKDLEMQWVGEDNCAAKTFVLRAGLVRLCAMDRAVAYELPIYTAPGWQTQVYFLASGDDGDLRASDLAQASMTMRRIGRGFARGDLDGQAIEGVRSALETTSGGVPDMVLEGYLWEKFENPLLGLLAAHAMQRRGTLKPATLHTVANNLANLIGPIPDVIALLLEADPAANVPPVLVPPMLRASWTILLEHSARRRDLIPRDSFAARIAKRVVGSGAWMLWQRLPDPAPKAMQRGPQPEMFSEPEMFSASEPPMQIKTPEDMQLAVRWLGVPASMLEGE
jgi:hypothetical protein